ncbi:hypothetical protein [Microvirga solisilvae]|uniref:hypothetical protein n=1 Tax=Microvirga solisilvae TaxID=2919498 RepID=UPI001FAF6588|nr:hypothetical protein [Microvirga solisilvae]
MNRLSHPASCDGSRAAGETQSGSIRQDDSAVPERQTPVPSPVLKEGAVEIEPVAWQIRTKRKDGSWGHWFAADDTTLATARAHGKILWDDKRPHNGFVEAECRPLYDARALTSLQSGLVEAQRERDGCKTVIESQETSIAILERKVQHWQERAEALQAENDMLKAERDTLQAKMPELMRFKWNDAELQRQMEKADTAEAQLSELRKRLDRSTPYDVKYQAQNRIDGDWFYIDEEHFGKNPDRRYRKLHVYIVSEDAALQTNGESK